ncbi:MAG: cytochrome c3 family protein [Pyrinomonadaceae bacterium]|nr:cytochrome c3 family protein [Pyrinomonadaceae bacterium]
MSLRTLKIISILITVIGAAVIWSNGTFRQYGDQSGYQPLQPINFSHKVHAGDNSINCTYCHTSADTSRVAGIPTAENCMACHDQVKPDSPEIQKISMALKRNEPIRWVKVNDLPDHAIFNHSRHVNAGVNCNTCHGPVETMERISQESTFSMGSCVNCHRTHKDAVLDQDGNPIKILDSNKKTLKTSTDCAVCHH